MRTHRYFPLTTAGVGTVIVGIAVFGVAAAHGSETASATITLASSKVVAGQTQYTYNLTLHNTSTDGSPIGTFWFGWIPDYSFLPSQPMNVLSPATWEQGFSSVPVGGDFGGGASIEWQASSIPGNALAAGNSLSGFSFTTPDSLATLGGNGDTGDPILTSFVYTGAPFSDNGYQFVVAVAPCRNRQARRCWA